MIKIEDIPVIENIPTELRFEEIPELLEKVRPIKDSRHIPEGTYCYEPLEEPNEENGWSYRVRPCPYWHKISDKPNQDNGYCSYMEFGDWEDMGLLWDQVKECGEKLVLYREDFEE